MTDSCECGDELSGVKMWGDSGYVEDLLVSLERLCYRELFTSVIGQKKSTVNPLAEVNALLSRQD